MKQVVLKDTLKKASKSVQILSTVMSPDSLYPTLSMSTVMKTPKKNKRKDPNDPEPAEEKDTPMNIPLPSCTAQV